MSNTKIVEKKNKVVVEENLQYSGQMQCVVTNQSGETIRGVRVVHTWSGTTQVFNALSMAPNESGSFSEGIQVGSGGNDEWSVRWIDAQNNCWYRIGKQCDVYSEDFDSGKPVYINLINGSNGFSVEMPESSSCDDNYVDSLL